MKQQKYTSTEAGLGYREVRKKMKAAKEGGPVQNIEKGMMSGNSKEAYNTLKALTKTQEHTSAVIKDSRGNILTDSTAVLNQWTEYCSGLSTTNTFRHLPTQELPDPIPC